MNKAIAGIATVTFGALVLTGCGGGSQGNSAHVKLMPVTTDTRGAVAHARALQHEQAVVKAQARAAAHAEVVKAQAHARAVAHQRAVVHAQAVARQARIDARAKQRAAQHAQAVADAKAAKKAKAARTGSTSGGYPLANCALHKQVPTSAPWCTDSQIKAAERWQLKQQGASQWYIDHHPTCPLSGCLLPQKKSHSVPWSSARCATAGMVDYEAHCK